MTMAMESGEEEGPSRLSRRAMEPPTERMRSKTPIMGKNVPRLARHHSEELLVGFDRSDSITRGRDKGRLSIESTFNATNHHRTASLRRRQKKRKSQKHLRGLSNESNESNNLNVSKVELEERDGPNNDITNEIERRESDSVKANVANEIAEALIESTKKQEDKNVIKIELIPDEYKEYKLKYKDLEEQIKRLEQKLIDKENECNDLKMELNNVKYNPDAQLLAQVEKLLVDVASDQDESEDDISDESIRNVRNRKVYGETDMPEADSCVMFGLKLF